MRADSSTHPLSILTPLNGGRKGWTISARMCESREGTAM